MGNARLVRASSKEPNVFGMDDTVMARYAYGGRDGIVAGFASELPVTVSSTQITVGLGRVVLHGWEVDVQSTITLTPTLYGNGYIWVYLEINLALESAEFKLVTSYTPYFPSTLGLGDDLTTNPFGTARLPIYQTSYTNGLLDLGAGDYVTSKIVLPHKIIDDIYDRLERLGFKEGVVKIPDGSTVTENTITRQGNYVIGVYHCSSSNFPQISSGAYAGATLLGTLPTWARPAKDISIKANLKYVFSNLSNYLYEDVTLCEDGSIVWGIPMYTITEVHMVFGYEAEPL